MVKDCDFLFQFRRDFQHGGDHDDGLHAVFEVEREFLELAHDGEISAREEGVKIFEEENCGFHLLDDLVEGGERVSGGGVLIFVGLKRCAAGNDAGVATPLENFFATFVGGVRHGVARAEFLTGNNVENRISRADEQFQFLLKVHIAPIVSVARGKNRFRSLRAVG